MAEAYDPWSNPEHGQKRLECLQSAGPVVDALFIAVPGIGPAKPDLWHDGYGESWLRALKCSWAERVAIYYFNYQLWSESSPSSSVTEEGAILFESLIDLIEQEKFGHCPILLFAHSLGGLVVKSAIYLAYQHSDRLLQNIVGAVLLACPHATREEEKAWEKIAYILRYCAKAKARHVSASDIAPNLRRDCLGFERAFNHLPVLSLHETVGTKVGGFGTRATLLVDDAFATTNTALEKLVPVRNKDHGTICHVERKGQEFSMIESFINNEVKDFRQSWQSSQQRVARTLSESAGSTVTSASSIPSHSRSRKEYGRPQNLPLFVSGATERTLPKLPCFFMPVQRNQGFSGRNTVLAALESALCNSVTSTLNKNMKNSGRKTYALCGPGGIGKTEVAAEFVHRLRAHDQFQAIFWIRAGTIEELWEDFRKVAIELELIEENSPHTPSAVRKIILDWLEKPIKSSMQDEATWLMILDNVNKNVMLNEYLPSDDCRGSVLITTRDSYIEPHVTTDLFDKMVVPPFEESEATQLLIKLTGRAGERGEWELASEVAKLLGCYPLAIIEAGADIARHEMSFPEYKAQYESERDRRDLISRRDGHPMTRPGYHRTLQTVWMQDDTRESGALLDVISLLDPGGIPEYIVKTNPACEGWKEYPRMASAFDKAKLELRQSSLVIRDRATAVLTTYSIIQDVVRANMDQRKFNTLFKRVFLMLSAVWPFGDRFDFGHENHSWTGPKGYEELLPHILRLQKLFPRFDTPLDLDADSIEMLHLSLDAAWYSIMCSEFTATESLLQMADTIYSRVKTNSLSAGNPISLVKTKRLRKIYPHGSEPTALEELGRLRHIYYHHCGVLALHINEPKNALQYLEKFTRLVSAKLGECPPGEDRAMGVGWNELGNAYMQNHNLKDAEKCYEKSIKALGVLNDFTYSEISMPLINLAFVYLLDNRLDKAAKTFQEALQKRETLYGKGDKSSFATGKLLLGFGNVRAAQGKWEQAYMLHHRCLMRYRATLGDHHNRTADAYVKMAEHLYREGEYDAALEHLDRALQIFADRKHDKFNPEKARAYYKRGKVLRVLGESDREQESFAQAMKLFKISCPRDTRTLDQLSDADFDEQIMFWSR